MKITLFLVLAAMLLPPVHAARQYPDFAAASQHVTDTGYIVFIYPAGWDRYGEKLCRKLIADKTVREAAGDAALLLAPVYQERNTDSAVHSKKAMGSLSYPDDMSDISYPALVFYEKEGRLYATLHGEALMNSSAAEVAKLVKQKLAAKHRQDELLHRANNTTDAAEKNKFYLRSARVHGISWPGGLREAMKRTDPGDKHGYLAALNYSFSIQQNESVENIEARLAGVLQNPLLSAGQKQQACASAIGHIRRTYGPMAGGALITKYAGIMQKLDAQSALGLSAPVVMRDWVRQYRYGQGWSDQIIPASPIPMLMQNVPVHSPGTYNITFKLTTGRDGIRINRLRLMDGSRCIAEDATPRDINWTTTQQTYTFTVRKTPRNPALEITYGNAPDKRSTWGDITVSKSTN